MANLELNVSMRDYHSPNCPYISPSRLWKAISGDMWQFAMFHIETPPADCLPDQTASMRKGSAVHAIVEGKFESNFKVVDRLPPKTSMDGELMLINRTMYTQALRIANALLGCPMVAEAVKREDAVFEGSWYTQDADSGELVKCRPDLKVGNVVMDWKTIRDTDERTMRNSLASYGYYVSASMTLDITGADEYWLVFVESQYPFRVVPKRINQAAIELGREQYKQALNEIAQCRASGVWPQRPEAEDLDLADWVYARHETFSLDGERVVL